MTIKPGPHQGFWIVDDKNTVIVWCHSEELANKRLEELNALS